MLQVSGLTKSYSSRVLFEDISFTLSKGECVGLVGRNGCGKSTLFKIVLGLETPDSGDIATPKGYQIGYLDQHISFTHPTVLEECCSALREDEQFDFYKAEKILFGLGFKLEDMSRHPDEFSGCYQLRMNLCKTLLQRPDLLLLDEPTNYLDIVSLRWLRTFLKEFTGESILITHDRGFMDSVTTHTMGIYRGKIKKISGQTSKFYDQVEEENIIHEKTRLNQQKKVDHMQSFVDRFRAQATKAKQAQSRIKQIEKMEVADALEAEQELGFRFALRETHAKTLLRIQNLSFSWGDGLPTLFSDIDLEVQNDDRIAVIGKNGKGKTTFLSVVAGELAAKTGEIIPHNDTVMGYYQQTHRKDLDHNRTIVEEITGANPKLTITQNRSICGAMMFSGEDAEKKIGVLSGGEQARVLLGKILACPCNVLLLDEPTNHLDMSSVESLEDAIAGFGGAVLLVTHNENLLRSSANKLIVFQNEKSFVFDGSYDEFLEKIGWEDEAAEKTKSQKKEAAPKQDHKQLARQRRAAERDLQKKEEQISKRENEIKMIQGEMLELSSSPTISPEQIKHLEELTQRQNLLQEKLDLNLEELMSLSDRLNELE